MYCANCGNQINENARFCASCGAAVRRETAPPAPVPTPGPVTGWSSAGKKRRKKGIMDVLLIPVATILILMGTGYSGLMIIGKTTATDITGYEQRTIINNDDSTRDPRRYEVYYEFAVNGERYGGSVTRIFEGGSHMRKTIQIRYLPFWPHVNAEDSAASGLAGPVMVGLGVLLLVSGVGIKARKWGKERPAGST